MYVRKVRVMPSDASLTGHIKLYNLLNYFQDTAELAVETIEGKSTELYARGYSWVVTRYEIEFHGELPKICDEFTITTYHDPFHSYNTLRKFHVSFGGEEVVTACTSWILADVNTGRPVKPIAHIPGIDSGDCQPITHDFRDIPGIAESSERETLRVKYHDTDYNGHVNHAVYFRWIYDMLSSSRQPQRICASFRSGARLGDTITIEGGSGLYRIMKNEQSRPCAEFMLMEE